MEPTPERWQRGAIGVFCVVTIQRRRQRVSLPVEVPLPAPIEGKPTWITIATCGDADLALRVELEGDYCGGWDDDPSFEGAFSRVF